MRAQDLAELDATFYSITGRWPQRPRLDPVLRAKARELAEVFVQDDDEEN